MVLTVQQEVDFITLIRATVSPEDAVSAVAFIRKLIRKLPDTEQNELYDELLELSITTALTNQTQDAETHTRTVNGLIQKRRDPAPP